MQFKTIFGLINASPGSNSTNLSAKTYSVYTMNLYVYVNVWCGLKWHLLLLVFRCIGLIHHKREFVTLCVCVPAVRWTSIFNNSGTTFLSSLFVSNLYVGVLSAPGEMSFHNKEKFIKQKLNYRKSGSAILTARNF